MVGKHEKIASTHEEYVYFDLMLVCKGKLCDREPTMSTVVKSGDQHLLNIRTLLLSSFIHTQAGTGASAGLSLVKAKHEPTTCGAKKILKRR